MPDIFSVLAAAAVAVVLGGLWYGPLFGKAWMKETGITHEAAAAFRADPSKLRRTMFKSYGLTIFASLIMAFILAHLVAFTQIVAGGTSYLIGVLVGFGAWLGFVVPVSLNPVLWDGKSWKYFFLTTGYYLVALILMGILLALWP